MPRTDWDENYPEIQPALRVVQDAIEVLLRRRLDCAFGVRQQAAYDELTRLEKQLMLLQWRAPSIPDSLDGFADPG